VAAGGYRRRITDTTGAGAGTPAIRSTVTAV